MGQLVVDALRHASHDSREARLCLEVRCDTEARCLVEDIAKLNAIVNNRGKGRDDLSVEILVAARKALKRRWGDPDVSGSSDGASMLATSVVVSFEALCDYLRKVNLCFEREDPNLCSNAELVARLVDWEKSWEIGGKYLQHEPLLHAICDVVEAVQAAQRMAPALIGMCTDCDVELFMVLPRIIWLRFIAAPTRVMELLKTFLPHRFQLGVRFKTGANKINACCSACPWDAHLAAFIEKFQSLEGYFSDLALQPDRPLAWETLIKRAVSCEDI